MILRQEVPIRPQGFPYSEEEFRELKKARLHDVVSGGLGNQYSEFALRGTPKERITPTFAIAVFPTPTATRPFYTFEPEEIILNDNHQSPLLYWLDVTSLPLPDKVRHYERLYFREIADIGDEVLETSIERLILSILPTGAVLFGRTEDSVQESAYLNAPTLVPPTAVYRHLIERAGYRLAASGI